MQSIFEEAISLIRKDENVTTSNTYELFRPHVEFLEGFVVPEPSAGYITRSAPGERYHIRNRVRFATQNPSEMFLAQKALNKIQELSDKVSPQLGTNLRNMMDDIAREFNAARESEPSLYDTVHLN